MTLYVITAYTTPYNSRMACNQGDFSIVFALSVLIAAVVFQVRYTIIQIFHVCNKLSYNILGLVNKDYISYSKVNHWFYNRRRCVMCYYH